MTYTLKFNKFVTYIPYMGGGEGQYFFTLGGPVLHHFGARGLKQWQKNDHNTVLPRLRDAMIPY